MTRTLKTLSLAALLLVPATAFAGKGGSYATLKRAINSGSVDGIISEVERTEKLPCSSCIDLVRPLIDDDSARVRDVAAWWLAKRAVRVQVREDMLARLQSSDSVKARNAAEVLGRFQHPGAIMALEAAMHDEGLDDEARAAAAAAIGSIGHFAGKAVLEGGLTSESAEVRAAAARALREIRGKVDAVAVVDLLRDEEESVVHEAVRTVGALREQSAVGDLLDVVTDDTLDPMVRRDAAWALGKLQDGSARDTLKSVAKGDASPLVRGAARAALGAL